MTVFIAHAKADAAAAEALKKVLDMRGLQAELEDGTRGYRPLGAQDSVVALWSKDALFDHSRLMFEKRALDAWADESLVLVKLDRQFAPVGLRDLPSVDASFEVQRDLVAWPEVAKRLAAAKTAKMAPPQSRARAVSPGGPAGGATLDGMLDDDVTGSGGYGVGRGGEAERGEKKKADRDEAAQRPAKRSSSGFGVVFGLVVAVAAGGLLAAIRLAPGLGLDQYGRELGLQPAQQLMALTALTILGLLLALLSMVPKAAHHSRAPKAAEAREEAPASVAAPAPAPATEEEASPDAVFISYARADGPFVLPVCDQMKRDGRRVWLDQEGIDPGENWAGEIVRAIRTVRGVAVMCSKAAFESDHVKREVYLADRYKKRLLPVLIDDTPMPDDFEYFFAGVQWLKLHETPEGERARAMAKALGMA